MLDHQRLSEKTGRYIRQKATGNHCSNFPSTIMEQRRNRVEENDVNGVSNQEPSSGRGAHDQQVNLDRHQATAGRHKGRGRVKPVKIAKWNVRTLNRCGKLENIKKEMDRLVINILGICEVRWAGAGKISSGKYTIIYSGGQKHENGVGFVLDEEHAKSLRGFWTLSDRVCMIKLDAKPLDINIIQVYAPTSDSNDEELDKFYSEFETAMKQYKSTDNTIIQRDFNAKVEKSSKDENVGAYGLGQRNERGNRLVEWAKKHGMIIGNTMFCQPPRRLWTWKSPGDNISNQIDYVMMKTRLRNSLISCKAYPGADCYSDHVPIIGRIRLKLKKLRNTKKESLLDYAMLSTDLDLRRLYSAEVRNKFEALQGLDSIENQWENLRECINCSEVIPKVKEKQNRNG